MRANLENNLLEVINNKYNIDLKSLQLREPPKKELWDFAFNCWVLAKQLRKNPTLIAAELIDDIKNIDDISKAEIDWAYINIKLEWRIYTEIFNSLYNDVNLTFLPHESNWKWISIDYIGANVWKPLHIWHMCTPNQWQVLINVYRKLWYCVISDSHIWDWWIIFWKLITAYKLWWDENKLKENAVDYLLELYVKITTESEIKWEEIEQKSRNEFKLLSEGNPESVELWREFTKYSIDAMQLTLDRFNIKADFNIWESFYEWLWLPKIEDNPDLEFDMNSIVAELIKKWIATKNEDNSVWVEFNDNSKIPSCILQKRDGTHWYLASDLAAIKYRTINYAPHKIIYFVDKRQQLHFQQAFAIAQKAWWVDGTELFHAANWFISLKDWAMSTRKGRIIKLDALLDEAELRAKKIILEKRDDINWDELENLSKIIWIWAIKYWYLKKSRETDVIFDWDEFMTFEGNSWPYIQYAYVRAIRILEKSGHLIDYKNKFKTEWDFTEFEETELIKMISKYTQTLEKMTITNSPHILCKYSYELTKTFNSFYNNVHILSEKDETKKIMRLKLVKLFSSVLKDSFELLWIDMPNKM